MNAQWRWRLVKLDDGGVKRGARCGGWKKSSLRMLSLLTSASVPVFSRS
jgi:hypothetical protein